MWELKEKVGEGEEGRRGSDVEWRGRRGKEWEEGEGRGGGGWEEGGRRQGVLDQVCTKVVLWRRT